MWLLMVCGAVSPAGDRETAMFAYGDLRRTWLGEVENSFVTCELSRGWKKKVRVRRWNND